MTEPAVDGEALPSYIKTGVMLAPYTTIGTGGPVSYFAEPGTEEDLHQALKWAASRDLPVLVLGGGSNLLCSDEGFDGVVVRLAAGGYVAYPGEDDQVTVIASAGVEWDDLVRFTVEQGLQGMECLSGIPGTVGASPIQNIGAYGQEVKDTIIAVEAIDRRTGEARSFTNEECEFSYRMSRFKGRDKDRYLVTSVHFVLTKNGKPALRYGDLTRYFEAANIGDPTLVQVREAVLRIRGQKAMVIDPAEPNSRSCGSFFTNPIVLQPDHERILQIATSEGLLLEGEKMPAFPASDGTVKLSAAWLMERAGLKKGFRLGNVGLSEKHVLAVVNFGGGTAAEVLELVDHVQSTVHNRFGVHLEPEPVFVGFNSPA